MKIYSENDLDRFLTEDLTWRLREVSDLKRTIDKTEPSLQYATCRAGIPIVYAHWEGHVKNSAAAYVAFIASKRLHLSQLKLGYSLGAFRSPLDRILADRANRVVQMNFLSDVVALNDLRFSGKVESLSDTKSNLSFAVLSEILTILGLDTAPFRDEASFIDKVLLERRNHIAHGHSSVPAIDVDTFFDTANRTIGLMREFSNRIMFAALYEQFKR